MARIPDFASLSGSAPTPQRGVPGYRAGIAEGSAAAIGEAAARLGAGGQDLAVQLARRSAAQQEQRNQLDHADATSRLLRAKVELDRKAKDDPDYASAGARYQASMRKATREHALTIADPVVKTQFEGSALAWTTLGMDGLNQSVPARERKAGRAYLQQALAANLEALMQADDEATRAGLLNASQGLFVAARENAWLTPEEAQEMGRAFVTDYAYARANEDPQETVRLLTPVAYRPDAASASAVDDSAAPATKTDTWVDFIPPEEAPAILRTAQERILLAQQDSDNALAAQQQAHALEFERALRRGEKTYADVERELRAGQISAADHARFTIMLDEAKAAREEEAALIARAAAAGPGGATLDPANSDDRKGANLLFERTRQAWAERTPAEQMELSTAFAAQKGIVPDWLQGEIRGGLRSGDPQKVLTAAEALRDLRRINPELLKDFKLDDILLGNQIDALIDAGVPGEQAVSMAMEASRVSEAQLEARGTEYDRLSEGWLYDLTDWFHAQVGADRFWQTPDAAMVTDFHRLARSYYQMTGDFQAARQTALDHIKRMWTVSTVGGVAAKYMKMAPEQLYGVPGMTRRENSDWMNEQLVAWATAFTPADPDNPITAERLRLRLDPSRTTADGKPMYIVSIIDDLRNPVSRDITGSDGQPLAWAPDWRSSQEWKRRDEAMERRLSAEQTAVDNAEAERQRQLRGELPPSHGGWSQSDLPPELVKDPLQSPGTASEIDKLELKRDDLPDYGQGQWRKQAKFMADLFGLDAEPILEIGPEILPLLGGIYAFNRLNEENQRLVLAEIEHLGERDPKLSFHLRGLTGEIKFVPLWHPPAMSDQQLDEQIAVSKDFLAVLDWIDDAASVGVFSAEERFPPPAKVLGRVSIGVWAILFLFKQQLKGEIDTFEREKAARQTREVPSWRQ